MASAKAKRPQALDDDIDQLNSTWGSVMDDGLREADETLQAGASADDDAREAWLLVSRAFASSVKALRDLSR